MNKNKESGFIQLLIMIAILLGAIIWLSYKHVSDVHKAKQTVDQINNIKQNVSH